MPTHLRFAPARLMALLAVILISVSCATKPVEAPPVDSDGDGVFDPSDQCWSTPIAAHVGVDGCPVDTDGDGVPDYLDECPDTHPGAAACRYGCALEDPIIINLVNDEFDFDKATLKPDMKTALDKLIGTMFSSAGIGELTVVGHTDNMGTDEYNLALSMRRATAVVDYLKANGLKDLDFDIQGKGESEPVDGNHTPEGRARNRRVEIFSHTSDLH